VSPAALARIEVRTADGRRLRLDTVAHPEGRAMDLRAPALLDGPKAPPTTFRRCSPFETDCCECSDPWDPWGGGALPRPPFCPFVYICSPSPTFP
jgi:hypothetical protein